MNDELIKRIDEWLNDELPGDLEELLQDCRDALSRKYVPLKPLEWADAMPGLKEADLYKVIMAEAVVIRRAGLEVEK